MLFAVRDPHSRSLTTVRVVCLALAATLVISMLAAFAGRIAFPYELEWMEGATIVHVQRLAAGEPVYARPSLDFVAFGYPPLYYVVCVPVTWIVGQGFLAARLVSAVATLATLAAIFAIVRRNAGGVQASIACGVFAGAYALSDGWLDLARVDALYIALLAAAWARITRARTRAHWVAAAGLVWLAFLTKQPALAAMVPLCVWLFVTEWRTAAWFTGTLIGLCVASLLVGAMWTDGWYWYYVVQLPRLRMGAALQLDRLATFWWDDLLKTMPVALILGPLGAIAVRRQRDACVAAGLVATAWIARLEGGAWNNAVLPAYLAVSVVFGIALQRLGRWTLPVLAAAAVQLALLLFDPQPFVPNDRDRAAGARLVERLRTLEQPVLLLDHNFWTTLAGGREYAHGWAVTDVVWVDREKAGPVLEEEVRRAILERRFGAIVTDGDRSWFQPDVEKAYTAAGTISDGEVYEPRSGAPRSPQFLYLRPR